MKNGSLADSMRQLGRDSATSDEWARCIEKLELERDTLEAYEVEYRKDLRQYSKTILRLRAALEEIAKQQMHYGAPYDKLPKDIAREALDHITDIGKKVKL